MSSADGRGAAPSARTQLDDGDTLGSSSDPAGRDAELEAGKASDQLLSNLTNTFAREEAKNHPIGSAILSPLRATDDLPRGGLSSWRGDRNGFARASALGDDSADDGEVVARASSPSTPRPNDVPGSKSGADDCTVGALIGQGFPTAAPRLVHEHAPVALGTNETAEIARRPPMPKKFGVAAGAAVPAGVKVPGPPVASVVRPPVVSCSSDGSDDDEVVRLTPYGRSSGLERQMSSWADEDRNADRNADRNGYGDIIVRGGLHHNRATTSPNVAPILTRRSSLSVVGVPFAVDDAPELDDEFAVTYPRRVSRLSTASPSPWWETPGHQRAAGDGDGGHFQPAPREGWLRRWSGSSEAILPRPGLAGKLDSFYFRPEKEDSRSLQGWGQENPANDKFHSAPSKSRWGWLQKIFTCFDLCREGLDPKNGSRGSKGHNESQDGGTGVRVWHWWDNFRNAPGMLARLCACTMAVCALWATSLSVAVGVTSDALPSPSLNEVIGAVVHAYHIIEEQREAYVKCIGRQSVYCDRDLVAFGAAAREHSIEALATTAATLEQATEWTESCEASVQEAQLSLKTWLAQGTGHPLLYSGECDSSDEALVSDLLGDVTNSREGLASSSKEFAQLSISAVTALSAYAVERSEYDAAYTANQSRVINIYAGELVEDVTFEIPSSLDSTYEKVGTLGNLLVACLSLRGDSDGECPVENSRALVDDARDALNLQIAYVSTTLEMYVEALDDIVANADEAYSNMLVYYTGVDAFLSSQKISIIGLGAWSEMGLNDFVIPRISLPMSSSLLDGFTQVPTAEDIWNTVSGAYDIYTEGITNIGDDMSAQVTGLAVNWKGMAVRAVANLSVTIDLADYDPPLYGDSSTWDDSNALLESTGSSFRATADEFSLNASNLLDDLGPSAANVSLPDAPALNSTFTVGASSTIFSSQIDYNFADFTRSGINFGSWVVSAANLAIMLIAADYAFRFISSVRLLIRFWGRAGLGLPDADLCIDKGVARAKGMCKNFQQRVVRVLLNPVTSMVFIATVVSIVMYNLTFLYVPLLADYRAGCVERTQNGSFFTQNMYSVVYNYASDGGNRDKWSFQEDYTSRQATICLDLTADIRQYLAETDLKLRSMYETHYDDRNVGDILGKCIDTAGMDDLYAEACCGRDGYDACTKNTTLECPLHFESGVAQTFGSVELALFNNACANETLDAAKWQVENGLEVDCNIIPTCQMTCDGPNEELVRLSVVHAGCMVEWLGHAGWLKGVATLIMFVLLNVSRSIVVGAVVKMNWRHMHTGLFTYKGTCTRTGELVTKQPDEEADKSEQATAAAAAADYPKDSALPGKSESAGSPKERIKALWSARTQKASPPGEGNEKDTSMPGALAGSDPSTTGGATGLGSRASRKSDATPEEEGYAASTGEGGETLVAQKGAAPTHKSVIAGAVEEELENYETGARRRVLIGILVNLPWIVLIWLISGGTMVYQPV